MLWNWNLHFPLYLNIVVLNGWGICTTSDEVLEILGEGHTLTGSYSQAGLGQQAEPLWSCLIANISVPRHDTGFHLPPLLFQTQTPIAIFTFIHWLLLWQSRIHLSLRSLKFFLGTRDTWSSREIIRTFLHSHRNLCKLQISQSLQKKKKKKSRRECSISLNSLRKYSDSSELTLCSGHFYSSSLKMCILISPRDNFFSFTS